MGDHYHMTLRESASTGESENSPQEFRLEKRDKYLEEREQKEKSDEQEPQNYSTLCELMSIPQQTNQA